MKKQVMLVIGAGQISLAIARRIGADYRIVVGDKNLVHAKTSTKILQEAGFKAEPIEMDLSSRQSIIKTIEFAQTFGKIGALINGAGLSPSQAKTEDILQVDLYGTAGTR